MEYPQVQPTPCPKCGGVRFAADGDEFGLHSTAACTALYCTDCGYVEFYASRLKLVSLAEDRSTKTQETI